MFFFFFVVSHNTCNFWPCLSRNQNDFLRILLNSNPLLLCRHPLLFLIPFSIQAVWTLCLCTPAILAARYGSKDSDGSKASERAGVWGSVGGVCVAFVCLSVCLFLHVCMYVCVMPTVRRKICKLISSWVIVISQRQHTPHRHTCSDYNFARLGRCLAGSRVDIRVCT